MTAIQRAGFAVVIARWPEDAGKREFDELRLVPAVLEA